ncbi:MAG: hypothetical protein QRY74_05655 [Chlamydia sp.]
MHFQDVGTFTSICRQSNGWLKSSEKLDTTENFSEFFKAALQEAKKIIGPLIGKMPHS